MKDLCKTFHTYYKEVSLKNQKFYNIAGPERWAIGKEGWYEALREITLQIKNASDFNLEYFSSVDLKRVMPRVENLFVWVQYVNHTQDTLHIFVEHFDIQ